MGNSKFNVSDANRVFFPDFLRAQNMVRVIGVRLYRNDLRSRLLTVPSVFRKIVEIERFALRADVRPLGTFENQDGHH